jgi:histidine triad (HIT) family protein
VTRRSTSRCVFCEIIEGDAKAAVVLEDEHTIAILDHAPLFHGHVLLMPKPHHVTLGELPDELMAPLFENTRVLARAVEQAMHAEGTFIAMNNKVSQSVPHLHVHVVPRRKGDGLRGFFWPRQKYASAEEMESVAESIRMSTSARS